MREREFNDVKANGGRSSCNEIQPHWIHDVLSGIERLNLLKLLPVRQRRLAHHNSSLSLSLSLCLVPAGYRGTCPLTEAPIPRLYGLDVQTA